MEVKFIGMQMKYIFIKKKEDVKKTNSGINLSDLESPIRPMLNKIFSNVSKDSFEIGINGINYKVNYTSSGNNLILNTNETDSKSVKILNETNAILLKGEHRKNYNIAISFDGVSCYYCNKIYPKFNLFERKIRELVFNILLKSFGNEWYEKTVGIQLDKEIKANAKSSSKSKLIEEALYEMTIFQLETYLFMPYREIDVNDLIDIELSEEAIKEKSRDEIIKIISNGRARSIWDRFFKDKINIDNIRSKLEEIRNYRNSVAHCKYFYMDEYKKCNQLLNGIIKQLDIAIESIESRMFRKIEITESLAAFSEVLHKYNEQFNISLEPMKKIAAELGKYRLPIISFDFLKLMSSSFSKMQPISQLYKMDYNILEDRHEINIDDHELNDNDN